MIKKLTLLYLISIMNLFVVLLILLSSLVSNNNHYGVSIDSIALIFSSFILLTTLFFKKKILILLSLVSLMLSISLNIFNISIHYDKWIKRGMPEPFTYVNLK